MEARLIALRLEEVPLQPVLVPGTDITLPPNEEMPVEGTAPLTPPRPVFRLHVNFFLIENEKTYGPFLVYLELLDVPREFAEAVRSLAQWILPRAVEKAIKEEKESQALLKMHNLGILERLNRLEKRSLKEHEPPGPGGGNLGR